MLGKQKHNVEHKLCTINESEQIICFAAECSDLRDLFLGVHKSERGGCPPNGLKEAPWARWWQGPPGKRHHVVSAASPSVINRGDKLIRVWEEKRRGVDPRAA